MTHDQEETMEVADTIIIINQGSVEQMETPEGICREPKTEFVDIKRYEMMRQLGY